MARKTLLMALGVAAGLVALQALLVPLFAGPAANTAPRDLPVAVVGQVKLPSTGQFSVVSVASAEEADEAIRSREVYAAFIGGPNGLQLHVASAASPAVSSLLVQSAAQLGGGKPVPVTDIVPLTSGDPRGGGFAGGFFPLALTSMAIGVLLIFLIRTRAARLAGVLTFSVLTGLVSAAVMQGWLSVLPSAYLSSAAAISLLALAISSAIAGLGAVAGPRGIGIGALTVFLIGNALGAVATAPELLPQPWGSFGQWLPIGAGSTLLRSAAYFGWAGSAGPLLALGLWSVLGLALVAVGRWTPSPATAAPSASATSPSPASPSAASSTPATLASSTAA